MGILKMVGSADIELSKDDTKRLMNMVRRNGMNFRVLDSGLMLNLNNILLIDPKVEEEPEPESEEEPEPEEPEEREEEPEPEEEPERLTSDQFKQIFEKVGISQAEFGKQIGYSQAAVRMALKEGTISQPFSDAVVGRFLDRGEDG